jgi:hypothetical protein
MFCPKCGKRQLSDNIRFCAQCGLALEPARKSLTSGNAAIELAGVKRLSPRAKGILQGLAIIPGGIGAMAVIDIFYEALGAAMMAPLYSMLTMIALLAIARILYAVFLEPGRPTKVVTTPPTQKELAPDITSSAGAALSAATGEISPPRSITEHTTRQLQNH